MYLPLELPKARVLIAVKTYPLPSKSYDELVCTAGLLDGEKWIRIYPIPFKFLQDEQQYPKYSWIELSLQRNSKDFRPESYRPLLSDEKRIIVTEKLDTANHWQRRKDMLLKEVFTSMEELIDLAHGVAKKSLGILKPKEIIDFVIEEDERNWKPEWLEQLKQQGLFEQPDIKKVVRKLPYKFYYKFYTEHDQKPRRMAIEDWEIGMLYWNCLHHSSGDETIAKQKVKQKYFDEFVKTKDIYLFVGTTLEHHHVSRNPFTIIGVFYPPKQQQLSLL